MLLSQKEERGRRFSLALRAGIPVLLLVFLVFYTIIDKTNDIHISTKDGILLVAITFIAIYFIYFLINLSVQETILDNATQGFNRKAFIEKLKQKKISTLACLSIENLASIQENYSTDQVDTLLYTIVNKLNLAYKQYGLNNVFIGRNGDSEFLIALNNHSEKIHEILNEMISHNKNINEIEIDYRFSIIADIDNNYEKTIIQLRDLIASQTVRSSRKKAIDTKYAKELSHIENCVIQSIQENNFLLSFRPILNTQHNNIEIYEIAVKLKSESNNHIMPRTFLPIVNRLGLGREYDYSLITHIIDILPLIDSSIAFTFNLSPFSLRDKTFQKKVFAYIKKSNIDARRLIIQLYERKTHHDLSSYLTTLKTFRAYGIRICIDNFGSSNASMEYMKHFKFDMVQFDRDYVTRLEDNTTYAMLNSLIKMSKDLQVQTVAKWVDNEEQKNKLRLLGIDYIQGFGVSKALNETDLINRYN
jgi:EAL domain-containing protein (putative c-di-GMP-specific phosphodiesterase class I)/GGDEF domain-containing protein